MAKDIRGLFQNNRRREAHAVTAALPFTLDTADLREGTPAVELASGDYTVLTLPMGVLVTGAYLVVEEDNAFDGTVTAQAKIGTVALFSAAIDCTKIGPSLGKAASFPILTSTNEDVTVTMDVTSATKGSVKIVLEYIDYNRATMSFIGEE